MWLKVPCYGSMVLELGLCILLSMSDSNKWPLETYEIIKCIGSEMSLLKLLDIKQPIWQQIAFGGYHGRDTMYGLMALAGRGVLWRHHGGIMEVSWGYHCGVMRVRSMGVPWIWCSVVSRFVSYF